MARKPLLGGLETISDTFLTVVSALKALTEATNYIPILIIAAKAAMIIIFIVLTPYILPLLICYAISTLAFIALVKLSEHMHGDVPQPARILLGILAFLAIPKALFVAAAALAWSAVCIGIGVVAAIGAAIVLGGSKVLDRLFLLYDYLSRKPEVSSPSNAPASRQDAPPPQVAHHGPPISNPAQCEQYGVTAAILKA